MATAPTQIVPAPTPRPNAGVRTRSTTLPSTIVLPTVMAAYTAAPVTATTNGSGCIRM